MNQGTFCVSRDRILYDKIPEQLKELQAATPALAKQIMFYGSKLRETRAY